MATASQSFTITVNGETFGGGTRYADTPMISTFNDSVEGGGVTAAKATVLTTRTDANTGEFTATAHGWTDSGKRDVYWTNDDGSAGHRYNMTFAKTGDNTFTLDGGGGDNLPDQDTACYVALPIVSTQIFAGSQLKTLYIYASRAAQVTFMETGDVVARSYGLSAGGSVVYDYMSGDSSPLAGKAVVQINISCGETTVGEVKINGMRDTVA